MNQETIKGHGAAMLTILIWGTTFISTKILLGYLSPVEILFYRFLLGFLLLAALYPKRLRVGDRKREIVFAAAGLCGICLYYLLENIALLHTRVSNVGVILSISPFFTAILSQIFVKKEEENKIRFFLGFLMAMAGICLLNFQETGLEWNPLGDGLAALAAFLWAIYSLLTKKISAYGYHTIQTTRRTFGYGLLFMLPVLFGSGWEMETGRLLGAEVLGHLLYLGIGASALCFVTWGLAVKILGAVRTSVYIYAVPIITVITAAVVLGEEITGATMGGMALTLLGLLLSEGKIGKKKEGNILCVRKEKNA